MLRSFRQIRRTGCEVLPGSGIRIPIALTSSTVRVRATRVISWKSECARLWYHQSRPAKQMNGVSGRPPHPALGAGASPRRAAAVTPGLLKHPAPQRPTPSQPLLSAAESATYRPRGVEHDRGSEPLEHLSAAPRQSASGVIAVVPAGLEERAVRASSLLLGSLARVVVQRQRAPGAPLRAAQRYRMPVIRLRRRAEDHATVEDRQNALRASLHLAVPELEVTSVLLAPIRVQVQQQVEATVQTQPPVPVEVGVDLEKAVALDLMQTAADEVRVGNHAVDAGEPLEEFAYRRRIELREHVPRRAAHLGLGVRRELGFGTGPESLPIDVPRRGKFLEHLVEDLGRHELVDDGVRKRAGVRVARAQFLGERGQAAGIEEEALRPHQSEPPTNELGGCVSR